MKNNLSYQNNATVNSNSTVANANNQGVKYYRLAASASNGRVAVYGESLTELCNKHYADIALIKDPYEKAREQYRYANFLLDNFSRFHDKESVAAIAESLITDAQLNIAASRKGHAATAPIREQLHKTAKRLCAIKAEYM